MRRRLHPLMLSLITIVLATACSNNHTTPPVAPSQVQTSSPAPVQTRQISGRVLDEDAKPIEGARVLVWDGSAGVYSAPVLTDGSGVFQASATVYPPPFHDYGDEVSISKNGYEGTVGWAPGTTDVTQDFLLYRPLTVTAGEAVHLILGPDNSLCGLESEFRCRPIHIRAPTSGVVVLDTVPDDPGGVYWIIVGGPYDVTYPFVGTTHNGVLVSEGSSALIQVMEYWFAAAPSGFTLKTSRIP
jgi:hypothetical protein